MGVRVTYRRTVRRGRFRATLTQRGASVGMRLLRGLFVSWRL